MISHFVFHLFLNRLPLPYDYSLFLCLRFDKGGIKVGIDKKYGSATSDVAHKSRLASAAWKGTPE